MSSTVKKAVELFLPRKERVRSKGVVVSLNREAGLLKCKSLQVTEIGYAIIKESY